MPSSGLNAGMRDVCTTGESHSQLCCVIVIVPIQPTHQSDTVSHHLHHISWTWCWIMPQLL